jgi:Zn-dependent oligopeptidase
MCRVYSTAIWSKFFANNPLDPESGQLYRNSILKYGGARDPELILLDVLGPEFQAKSIQSFIAEHVKGKN